MTNKYLKDTKLIQCNPENTGLLPSDTWHSRNKMPINPLRTILNPTFTKGSMSKLLKDKKKKPITIEYLQEHQQGIIEAYKNYYGDDWKTILTEELEGSKDFLGKGLKNQGEKSVRSIHITQEQWNKYQSNGGYKDHCFSCEARPDILIIDIDYEITEEQLKKIERSFKKYLWVIEQNTEKGSAHIYIQTDDNTAITKVKAGLKEDEKDKEPLDIDIFKGGLKHVIGTTPSRNYKILYDEEPKEKIPVKKAIRLLSKTLDYYLDQKTLEEILQPPKHKQKTTTTKTVPTGEITVTGNEIDNERSITIVENAIPIFTKLADKGVREELYKSLIGALLKNGFNNKTTKQIMTQIYNNTNDPDPRLTTVANALDLYQEDPKKVSGWTTFQKTVNEHNNPQTRIGGNLQRIADTIFLNKPPIIKTVNPQTEQIETAILLENNEGIIYEDYPETAENTDKIYTIDNAYSDYKIIVDYEHKSIAKRTLKKDRKNNVTKEDTLIITAVPTNLVVYNDVICHTGRQYSCIWSFDDGTEQEITGDILLHNKTLLKGAGVWNKTQLQNTISAVFGDLSRTKAHGTIIKNTPQQKGFYYDKDKEEIIVVDHQIHRPTPEQLLEALQLLDVYSSYFGYFHFNPEGEAGVDYIPKKEGWTSDIPVFKSDPTRLAVFLRWCLNAPFHYVRKQFGMTNEQYIFLSGESGVGKTYGYLQAGLFMLGIEEPKEYIVSGGSNSKAQISKNLAKTTFPVIIDEGDRIFNEDHLTSLLKHSTQGLYSREVTDTDTNKLMKEPALAPLGFSANNVFDDTEKGGLSNRVVILPFTLKDIPTKERKKLFTEEFNTDYSPEDKRRVLKWIGYEFQYRILENPKTYIHSKPDKVVKQFFEDICHELHFLVPLEWINNDFEGRTAEDDLQERHETLKDILKTILNRHMEHTLIKEDQESYTQTKLTEDDNLTWNERILILAESQKVSWLHTTKSRDRLIITNGVIRAIKKEDKNINLNTLVEFRDLLQNGKYSLYDVKRYTANENGTKKQMYNSLRLDVEVISDLYEVED